MSDTTREFESVFEIRIRAKYGNDGGSVDERAAESHTHYREKRAQKVSELPGVDSSDVSLGGMNEK